MEHKHKNIRLKIMKFFKPIESDHSPKKYLRVLFMFSIIFMVILSGCHFPGYTPSFLPKSNQRKTEIAAILNPTLMISPTPTITPTPNLPIPEATNAPIEIIDDDANYTTQQGDTLSAIASRFAVPVEFIESNTPLNPQGLLPIGLRLRIPFELEDLLQYQTPIFPDCEVLYGPSVDDFDPVDYAEEANGFLSTYIEQVKGEAMRGPEIVEYVAITTSTNPRLLLAFLEYQSGWVRGHPEGAEKDRFPIGYGASDTGLYNELMITAKLLAQGFYGWRDGSLTSLSFYRGGSGRLSPGLNAGSTALMHLFATIYLQEAWDEQLFGSSSFLILYQEMFGDPWSRASVVEPYLLHTTQQPNLALPFSVGERWSFTGGPHITWQTGTPWGAVDFAPITGEPACAVSTRWATSAAPGLVVRSDHSVVAIDLDGDGDEGTGWVLIYQHMAEKDRVEAGEWLDQDDPVGHPSCEGGQATGTHVHFARKFNGEWLGVGDPLPLILSGWQVFATETRYVGTLQKGDQIVSSRPDGSSGSTIIRDE